MLERAEPYGGYALGTGNSVPDYVPDENYFAMIGGGAGDALMATPFAAEDSALVWRSGPQTVRIEPWGRDSLRVRATVNQGWRELPGALRPKPHRRPQARHHAGARERSRPLWPDPWPKSRQRAS